MINSFLTSGLIKMAGLVGPGDRDYLRKLTEENAQQRAAIEAGKRKLMHFYKTGEGYEPFMDPHIASHFGVKAESLNDPRVLNAIYKRLTGVPNEILQIDKYNGPTPAMGPVGTSWNPGGSAMDFDYRNAILKRIENYTKQKADNFANSSLEELGQFGATEDISTPDLNIEDPGLMETQVNSTPPVVDTIMPEAITASPVVNPVINPVDKSDYTSHLNEAQKQLNREQGAGEVVQNVNSSNISSTSDTPAAPVAPITGNADTPVVTEPQAVQNVNSSNTLSTPATPAPSAPNAPVAVNVQSVQNPFYSPKAITRQQMRQYRRYTGANDMKSDMDRWKTYQAMNGNRNASNADYYAAKRTNMLDKVVNPVTSKSK